MQPSAPILASWHDFFMFMLLGIAPAIKGDPLDDREAAGYPPVLATNSRGGSRQRVDALQTRFAQAQKSYRSGNLAEARRACEWVLGRNSRHGGALDLLATIYCRTGKFREAEPLLRRAMSVFPDDAELAIKHGAVCEELGRPDEALTSYDRVIAIRPNFAEAHHNRAVALLTLDRQEEAVASFDRVLSIDPTDAEAWLNRGHVLRKLGRTEDALASFDRALSCRPNFAEAHYNRGSTLQALQRPQDALASYGHALSAKPDFPEALFGRANILAEQGRFDEAFAAFGKALAIRPEYAEAYNNRGNMFLGACHFAEALADFSRALAIRPDYPEAYLNRGNALRAMQRYEEALADYSKALSLRPDDAVIYCARANTLSEQQRDDLALDDYRKALSLGPGGDFTFGHYLVAKLRLCDWDGVADNLRRCEAEIAASRKSTAPFAALSFFDSPELHRKVASTYAEALYPANDTPGPLVPHTPTGKIRIGYYSADFHLHATTILMAELFEFHDRERFELYAFSFGPNREDEMRQRISVAFDKFLDVWNSSDTEVAALSRRIGIDIAIDLKGYTLHARPGIFAARCAPVQVAFLGYPGTMATDYFDYAVANKTVIDPESAAHFSEKIVYLPHYYQPNDSRRGISDRVFTRTELGLPEQGFVFCCFNQSYKISPPTFESWMRIMRAVDDSVLWLLGSHKIAAENLRKAAESHGINGDRLIFAPPLAPDGHLARLRLADLFLDTLPYNAHTTASDALWAGLPLLTLMGRAFAGRVAASLLRTMDLPELITHSQDEYEAKAIELATDRDLLTRQKARIAHNRTRSPLFDGKLFARHFGSALETMYRRHQAGLPPADIAVTS